MWLVEFSLAHRIPVACFSCHKINKISISWLNYSRKQEILLKNLLQNQQNLKARGIYSCTGLYFFKSAQCLLPLFLFSVIPAEKFCVSWALPLIECVAVWALKLPVPHTDVLKTHEPQNFSAGITRSQRNWQQTFDLNQPSSLSLCQ